MKGNTALELAKRGALPALSLVVFQGWLPITLPALWRGFGSGFLACAALVVLVMLYRGKGE